MSIIGKSFIIGLQVKLS